MHLFCLPFLAHGRRCPARPPWPRGPAPVLPARGCFVFAVFCGRARGLFAALGPAGPCGAGATRGLRAPGGPGEPALGGNRGPLNGGSGLAPRAWRAAGHRRRRVQLPVLMEGTQDAAMCHASRQSMAAAGSLSDQPVQHEGGAVGLCLQQPVLCEPPWRPDFHRPARATVRTEPRRLQHACKDDAVAKPMTAGRVEPMVLWVNDPRQLACFGE